MSSVGDASQSFGREVLSASLAKASQIQQGKTVLKLLDSTATVAPGQTETAKAPAAVDTLGQHINVRV